MGQQCAVLLNVSYVIRYYLCTFSLVRRERVWLRWLRNLMKATDATQKGGVMNATAGESFAEDSSLVNRNIVIQMEVCARGVL